MIKAVLSILQASLQTSHSARLIRTTIPHSGAGELQETRTTLCRRHGPAMPNNSDGTRIAGPIGQQTLRLRLQANTNNAAHCVADDPVVPGSMEETLNALLGAEARRVRNPPSGRHD